jgi:hypothetical protein
MDTKGCKGIPLYSAEPMPLRDWFAGMALQGIIANESQFDGSDEKIATWAYNYADAMIKERDKQHE